MRAGIGSLNERPLHAALKQHVAPAGSAFEVAVGGYFIDAVCAGLLIEVQTRSLGKLRPKLLKLLPDHRLRLVMPIAARSWIVKQFPDGSTTRRRSPKRAGLHQLFGELVALPTLLAHPNLELQVVLTEQEESRRFTAGRAWRRRGWLVEERRLLGVVSERLFREPGELLELLPAGLGAPFTTAQLALRVGISLRLAQQMAYCLHALGLLRRVGRLGNAHLYEVNSAT